jgi:Type II CAAX prenyl endopeptidase Rce1-like
MTRRAASLLRGCAGLLLVATTAWVLLLCAQRQWTTHLRDEAAQELALAASGGTPYHWRLSNPGEVIAARVFSARDYAFGPDELVVTSEGRAFEVGLVLARPVDVRRFSGLRVSARCDPATLLRIRVRERLDAPEVISAATPFGASPDGLSLNLSSLVWTRDNRPAEAPRAAAMLRLSFALPAGEVARLHTATLDRAPEMWPVQLDAGVSVVEPGAAADAGTVVYRLPGSDEARRNALDALATGDAKRQVLVLLPQAQTVEKQLTLRNDIYRQLPGATVIPETALPETFARAHELARTAPVVVRWLAVIAYVSMLMLFRLRPPRRERQRAFLEIALALAGPLWLIVVDGFDGNPDGAQKLLIGASILYAISLSVPKTWNWIGSARAWTLAAAIVAVALGSDLLLNGMHGAERALGQAQVARYLLWALFQQYLICAVCTERWRTVTRSNALAVYFGALGFALLHFPNGALMLATLAGGLCWCALYLRERALLPLAASHAACAIVLLTLLPREILWSAEVSARFFQ